MLSRSSAKAEYRGVANAVAETCWIRNLIHELHTPLSFSNIMYCDNRKYAMEILECAHMVGCNPSRTHVDTGSKLGDGGTPVVDPTLYRSLAEPHFSSLKWILRYVQGTLDYGLQLFSSTTNSLIAYSDADWAGCPTTAKAEYRGVANAVVETCWIRNLLHELHTPLSFSNIMYCDNVQGEPPAVDQKVSETPIVDNRPPATVTPLDTELPVGITHPFPYWTPQKNQSITVDLHKMPPKRSSTSIASASVVPAMDQAAIWQLISDGIAAAIEALAVTMTNTNNPNRNLRSKETPVAKRGNYKEFISY
nr:hypothetical protein [Tanacetum cinerariifolium]